MKEISTKDAQNRAVVDLLRRTAVVLRCYEWVQGVSWHPARRALDLQGALAVAGGARKDEFGALDVFEYVPIGQLPAVLATWDALDGYLAVDPVAWNDEKGRSADEVVQMLLNLADLLEAGIGF